MYLSDLHSVNFELSHFWLACMNEELLCYPGVSVAIDGMSGGVGGSIDVSKMLNFTQKLLCDGLGAVKEAFLYADRSCFKRNIKQNSSQRIAEFVALDGVFLILSAGIKG